MRQTTGSMICPECGKLIGVGEEKCPFCGAWRPGLYGFTPAMQRMFGMRLDLINLIVVACGALYITSLALQPRAIFRISGFFGILSPDPDALYWLGMTGGPGWLEGRWWTLLTAIYLHGSLLHIFFNVMWIRSLGNDVTEVFGPARAFVIFSLAGAFGFLLSNLASGSYSMGASGSIFGLLAALIVYGRKRGSAAMTFQLWQWAALMFVMGFMMSGVNNWAHAGGFVGGWLTAQAMRFSEKRESRGVQLLALGLLGLTATGFVFAFLNVTRILLVR
jgi:rhomboid protease GluP